MKPVAFDYARPETQEEALDLLAEFGSDAVLLAGGMSLGPMLNLRLVKPSMVVDIGGIAELGGFGTIAGTVATGALLRQSDAMGNRDLVSALPLLGLALPWVGHVQTRNRGTLGGSIAHADPSAEIPLCLATLNGQVALRSRRGRRRVAARDFFLGILTTSRGPDEMVVALEWPEAGPGEGFGFEEIAQRHGDFAIAASACRARIEDGALTGITVGLAGVEDRPVVFEFDEFSSEPPDDPDLPNELAEFVSQGIEPLSDHAASASHRRMLARGLVRRTMIDAIAAAGEAQ